MHHWDESYNNETSRTSPGPGPCALVDDRMRACALHAPPPGQGAHKPTRVMCWVTQLLHTETSPASAT